MPDPISVIEFTIAILDALIKSGERTAEIISDVKAFESDSGELHNLVTDETIQSKLLRQLLFSKSSIYHGETLFEQFEPDIQKQIELLFHEIKSILNESLELLERRYGLHQPPSQGISSVRVTSVSQSSHSSGRSSPSLPKLLRWSLRDKKRVESILRTFKDKNSRLKKKVELWCLSSQLGLSADHLTHLKSDGSSKRLGFDKDASLRLAQWDADNTEESLELTDPLWDSYLVDLQKVEHQGRFASFQKESICYIQESHRYESQASKDKGDTRLNSQTKARIDSLAKLLQQPKEQIFRVLPCIGWKHLPSQQRIAFVFEVPGKPPGGPVSLQHLLFDTSLRPGLGDKFQLALRLSQCIGQMHMVQWLHESFRSDNIFMFPHQIPDSPEPSIVVNYAEPWVLGFEFSRPEQFFSNGLADFEPTRDIYRHPDRQGQPSKVFEKKHDIYALGVVLLEIGLWEPAIKLEKNMFSRVSNPRAVQAQLLKHAEKRLEHRVGRRYKEAVIQCLTGEFGVVNDTKDDLKLQQAFRQQVIEVIEMAATYI